MAVVVAETSAVRAATASGDITSGRRIPTGPTRPELLLFELGMLRYTELLSNLEYEGSMTQSDCDQFHSAVELIGARWSGAILRALFQDHQRYSDIRSAVPGISDTMLAQRLRDLEHRGLVERWIPAGHPVRAEYRLTEMGRQLHPVLDAITTWSQRWIPIHVESRPELAASSAPGSSLLRSAVGVADA